MKKKLSKRAKYAIIEFLVKQEQPETLEDAKAIALDWQDKSDEALIEANNYNLEHTNPQKELANAS
jgi:hypothetical protein